MNITAVLTAASLVTGLAGGFGGAWLLRTHTIDQLKLEQKDERIAIQRAARTAIERSLTQVTQAQNASTLRAAELRRSDAAAASESERMRDSTATTVRAAATDPTTCPERAAALGELLDAMGRAGEELAGKAGRHVSDIKTMIEMWQK